MRDVISGPDRREGGINTLSFWAKLAVITAVVISGLVFGAGFLIPLTFALILFVLLTAVIDWIAGQKIGDAPVPRWLAHIIGILLVLTGLGATLLILGNQATGVSEALPRYEAKLAQIIARLISAIGEENAKIVQDGIASLDYSAFAATTFNSASAFLSGFLLVLLYIPFLMSERAPMQEKLKLAAGDPETGLQIASILSDISEGVQKYVGIKTVVSLITGLLSYAVMKPMGLDFAETWSVLTFMLNFIPSIGSVLAVIFPALVALVQFDTLTPFLIIVFGCGIVQFTIGNILEPALTGKSLNLSPFMVILSLTFWTSIWGAPGALLSVPITVCVLIVFSHLPATRPVAILMSGDGQLRSSSEPERPTLGKSKPPVNSQMAAQTGEAD
ncbi:AI-2E family transporter [Pseudophaeobacter sp.]|uniref:AI-2E family transporter n=1 Tax=Pseudophaeobacter sp. TaxID=1971739 RepID=UPI003298635C